MNSKKICLISATALLFLPGTAMAQVINELNVNINDGASITSNADNTHPGQEYFVVNDSGTQVFYADGDVQTNVSNLNDVGLQYDTDNNGVGTFSLSTGGANVLSANNTGNVTVHNSMFANGIHNGNDGITNAGAVSGVTTLNTSGLATLDSASVSNTLNVTGATTLNDTLGVSGATTLGNTLGVAGATTLNDSLDVSGATTLNTLGVSGATILGNTLAVDTNGGVAGGTRFRVDPAAVTITSTDGGTINRLNNGGHVLSHVDGLATNAVTIADTQQETIGPNTFDFGTRIDGGALIEGDLGVKGSVFSSVGVGNNGLSITGANNTTALIADSNDTASDGRSAIILQEDKASLTVQNQTTGEAHGLAVDQTQTVLSGGMQSTSLTLNDNAATFANTTTGGPARVTGVADGTTRFDAVNFGQLTETNAGVASVAAMANIPGPGAGKTFSLGVGYGNFAGENAFAVGGVARLDEYVSLQASYGHSNEASTVGAGIGFSW